MTQLQLRSSSFLEHGSVSSSGALFFHGSDFCSFSHINIFGCLGVPQVKWKMNYTKCTKLRKHTKLFWVI